MKALYTKAEKVNARGNAQANIMIIPNCNANSKKSAGGFWFSSVKEMEIFWKSHDCFKTARKWSHPVLISISTKHTSSSFKIKSTNSVIIEKIRDRKRKAKFSSTSRKCFMYPIQYCNSNSTETPLYKTKGLLDTNKNDIYNTLKNKIKCFNCIWFQYVPRSCYTVQYVWHITIK